jgi:hypothetical protein
MKRGIFRFAGIVFFLAGASLVPRPLAAQAAAPPHPLVGSWRFLRYEVWDSVGAVSAPFGRPFGYIVFDPNGLALVQLMGSSVGAGNLIGFGAYFGRYTIDPKADTVRIRVEGANFDGYQGTVQVRPFRIQGDTLVLSVPKEYRATLVRVKPGPAHVR